MKEQPTYRLGQRDAVQACSSTSEAFGRVPCITSLSFYCSKMIYETFLVFRYISHLHSPSVTDTRNYTDKDVTQRRNVLFWSKLRISTIWGKAAVRRATVSTDGVWPSLPILDATAHLCLPLLHNPPRTRRQHHNNKTLTYWLAVCQF